MYAGMYVCMYVSLTSIVEMLSTHLVQREREREREMEFTFNDARHSVLGYQALYHLYHSQFPNILYWHPIFQTVQWVHLQCGTFPRYHIMLPCTLLRLWRDAKRQMTRDIISEMSTSLAKYVSGSSVDACCSLPVAWTFV